MDGNDRLRAWRDRRFNNVRVHKPRTGIDIDKDRRCPGVAYGRSRGDKRQGCRNDFVTRADIQSDQGKLQSRGAGGHRYRLIEVGIGGEFLFESSGNRSGG